MRSASRHDRPPAAIARQRVDVYGWCMKRTNIELDEKSVRIIMRRYRLRTKKEAVNLALRHLAGMPMTRKEALAMEGAHAIGELAPDEPVSG